MKQHTKKKIKKKNKIKIGYKNEVMFQGIKLKKPGMSTKKKFLFG